MKFGMLLAVGLTILGSSAFADDFVGLSLDPNDPFTLTFDETGACTLVNNGTPLACQGVLAVDPTQPGSHMILTFALPTQIGTGDVAVKDSNGLVSDLFRFTNQGGIGYLLYYSADTGGGQLADTGLPGNANTSLSVDEDPATGQFHFFSGGAQGVNNDYFGTSGADVPEPGSWALLGTLAAGVFFIQRRYRGRALNS